MLDVACPTPIHFGFLDAFSNCIVGINSWITDTSTKDKGKREMEEDENFNCTYTIQSLGMTQQ
jgi:hypothetical protein